MADDRTPQRKNLEEEGMGKDEEMMGREGQEDLEDDDFDDDDREEEGMEGE
jgi:hypothetical protein